MVERAWSPVARAEVVRHGYAVFGRPPQTLLPIVDGQDIRRAARAELTGYWAKAAYRPWWWLDRTMIDLGLTSMARGRHALRTGQLLTKTAAIEAVDAPPCSWIKYGRGARGSLVQLEAAGFTVSGMPVHLDRDQAMELLTMSRTRCGRPLAMMSCRRIPPRSSRTPAEGCALGHSVGT